MTERGLKRQKVFIDLGAGLRRQLFEQWARYDGIVRDPAVSSSERLFVLSLGVDGAWLFELQVVGRVCRSVSVAAAGRVKVAISVGQRVGAWCRMV